MVWTKPQELKDDLTCRVGVGGKQDNLYKNLAPIHLKLETPGSELQALGAGFEVHESHTTRVTASQQTHTPSNTQHIPPTYQHYDTQVLKQPSVGQPPTATPS